MNDLAAHIDREIREVEAERVRGREAMEAARTEWRETDKGHRARITQLRRARALVSGVRTPAEQKAGKAAIEKVESKMREKGRSTQADLTRDLGLNSGQIAYAVQSLEQKGALRRTGKKVRRSHEFEFVAK